MEFNNLFEEDRQLKALAEFNMLAKMKKRVVWDWLKPVL